MEIKQFSAKDFRKMIQSGANNLTRNKDLVDSLNVFPVPDGDTGTNMNMTFTSGNEKLTQTVSDHVGELAQSLAKGLLMGARGNSGVILSQIFRGFSKAIEHLETLDAEGFVSAFSGGVESAYKAVMKPVEGTILTVARESAMAGEHAVQSTDNIVEIMEAIVEGARRSLDNTPNLLPVLKQVGVVDSGGKGLLCIYEGFLESLTGESLQDESEEAHETVASQHTHAIFNNEEEHPLSMDDITYGFCTEIMVRIDPDFATTDQTFDTEQFRETLNTRGDSLLVVADDEIIKVHIHTENPGEIMQLGQQFGELIKIKVDNMREQVREIDRQHQASRPDQPTVDDQAMILSKPTAVITVAAGEGMHQLFESIGADVVLSGGQTMNPSTEDFVKAIETVKADKYIILPNNKNIIMAAEQVSELIDQPVVVIPTRSIPQAVSAMLVYNEEATLEDNQEMMLEMMGQVKTGQITYSIRDTQINDIDIHKDDYMGLIDDQIELVDQDLTEALYHTLDQMVDTFSSIVTIYIGEEGDENEVNDVIERLSQQYSDIEFEVVEGNQPVYNYIMSVE